MPAKPNSETAPGPRSFLTRVIHFSAAHHYRVRDWSEEENVAAFGDQVHPHGHNYRVEVTVSGPPHPDTGFVVDLPELDSVLQACIQSPLDNRDLNQVIPEIRSGNMQPSTEALARWMWGHLAPDIPPPARLERVRVAEGDTLWAEVHRTSEVPLS